MNHHELRLSAVLAPSLLAVAPLSALGLVLTSSKQVVEIDEARIFTEYNATDQDIGLHLFWDADAWDRMQVTGPEGDTILKVRARRGLADQGLTEGFFESDEPNLSELSLEEFLERFPSGDYEFEGVTLDGEPLEGEAEFSHVLPAAPTNLFPTHGSTVGMGSLVLSFDAVTQDLQGNPLSPELYEVVLEHEGDILKVFSVVLDG